MARDRAELSEWQFVTQSLVFVVWLSLGPSFHQLGNLPFPLPTSPFLPGFHGPAVKAAHIDPVLPCLIRPEYPQTAAIGGLRGLAEDSYRVISQNGLYWSGKGIRLRRNL